MLMVRSTAARKRRLAELKQEVAKPGFDRHAFHLRDVCELPSELQGSSVATLVDREAIQSIIVFPAQIQRGWHYVPKQALLFTATGVMHLLASIWPEQEPQVTCLHGGGLMYVKATLLLLYGYLEIVAQGQDSPVRIGMEFNTVSWDAISAPLWQFLGLNKTVASMSDQVIYSAEARRAFEMLPFKFFNGVQLYGLLPGEQVEKLVFEAGLTKRRLYFFRQPITADTLLMLTTNYMIVIQEDIRIKQSWILYYIPRNSICTIQSKVCGLSNELSIQLKRRDQIMDCKLLVTNQAVDAWRSTWIADGGQWQDLSCQPV